MDRRTGLTPTQAAGKLTGLLLGTAVGDALGLPREALSPRRAARLFGKPPLHHRFLLGRGMVSDDTDHACLVGQALLQSSGNAEPFARALAWRLRWWLLSLPAGLGFATLRALAKLWLGCSPQKSGVWSAGNGPAMRAPLLGVCLGEDLERLRSHVRASTRLTHTDPRAERGALLIALAAYHGAHTGPASVDIHLLDVLQAALNEDDDELLEFVGVMRDHLQRGAAVSELADSLGLEKGVTGYVYHTVPVALYCWLRWPGDFRTALEEVITLGGDTDTTGAIVGALVGATVGSEGIPSEWIDGLLEWPRSVSWMRALACRLAAEMPGEPSGRGPVRLIWPALMPRNLLFLAVVLGHGFRRLLPPY